MGFTSSNNKDDDTKEEGESQELELELQLGPRSGKKPRSTSVASSSSSSSSSSSLLQLQLGLGLGLGLGFDNGDIGEGSVVASGNYHDHHVPSGLPVQSEDLHLQPTRVETNGVWFALFSAPNREGEMLPQISRAYIRVKDEEATVLLVKLYLAKKLGLRTEAGIEILCMGHPLLNGSMKLTYVRDFIWRPRILARSLSAIASGNDGNDPAQYYLMRLSYSLT
ncbi:probable E3 ubiquitin protein ligase DRIPH isoform X1 [Macadamia integrifolia]|uniref:probable E3 ubiquitin protein ligase DRIPH isoform X1 n=1 Tax=Macadamia integrifolia TaxID=60698 RepID=UPI001C4F5A36|nr:probable E3 ubiquitin protein ligase DRIPH isoform X1 [Macadamia integrifolia]